MRRRKRNQKQVKIVIGTVVCLLLIMTVGYAAFSTTLNITAKGNIKNITAAMQLKKNVVTSGDGLYIDNSENGRYVYKGSNPNNYLTFNDELWRVISIESDKTLKIVKEETIGTMPFDEATTTTTGPRLNSNNTYCQIDIDEGIYYGCPVFGKVSGLINHTNFSGTVTEDSTLSKYLNNDYYNGLKAVSKEYVQQHSFNIGGINGVGTKEETSIKNVVIDEHKYKWTGNIGLINVSDYLNASLNSKCTSIYSSRNDNSMPCKDKNYLYKSSYWYWTMNYETHYVSTILVVHTPGNISMYYPKGNISSNTSQVRPAIYLKSNISLNGSGTENDPYTIK